MIIRRLREFPSVRKLEDQAILDPNFSRQEGFYDRIDAITTDLFGVISEDVEKWLGAFVYDEDGYFVDYIEDEAYKLRVRELYRDCVIYDRSSQQLAAYCSRNGWDVCSDEGLPLILLDYLEHPLLAAIAGVAGARLPEGGSEDLAVWEAKFLRGSTKPGSRVRSQTQPISEDERQRRNKEAKLSTVWRPQRRA